MTAVGKEGKADLLISWYDEAACGCNIAAWRKVRRNGTLVEVCVHPPAQQLTLVSVILHQEAKKVAAMKHEGLCRLVTAKSLACCMPSNFSCQAISGLEAQTAPLWLSHMQQVLVLLMP